MKPRRLLIVTYYYPPQPGSGSNRWAAMVKYLRRAGHEVSVVTAAPPGHRPGVEDGVTRTGNLNSSRPLRRLLLRPGRSAGQPSSGGSGGGVVPPVLWRGIVPDPWLVTWNPYAWRAIRREHAQAPADCVISSSPAESTHLLPLALGRHRPAWVADFRDGWCFEPLREPFPLQAQRAADRALERKVVLLADLAVGVTAPIAEDLQQRFGVSAVHIPNGFDPEVEPASDFRNEFDRGRLTLVHTGPLLGPRGRDPRPLLSALRHLVEDEPALAGTLQMLVAGRSEFDEDALLAEAGLGTVVQHLGYLPRTEALALQRAARALVLLTSGARCEATGKLYEYLAADRPIIALADGNEAARIINETGTGVAVPPDDVDAIAAAIRSAINGELERRYAPHGRAPYTYPAPADKMAEAIEAAIEARQAHLRGPGRR
jgi:glycosyltransferase involved in cell wall biosynthesis